MDLIIQSEDGKSNWIQFFVSGKSVGKEMESGGQEVHLSVQYQEPTKSQKLEFPHTLNFGEVWCIQAKIGGWVQSGVFTISFGSFLIKGEMP